MRTLFHAHVRNDEMHAGTDTPQLFKVDNDGFFEVEDKKLADFLLLRNMDMFEKDSDDFKAYQTSGLLFTKDAVSKKITYTNTLFEPVLPPVQPNPRQLKVVVDVQKLQQELTDVKTENAKLKEGKSDEETDKEIEALNDKVEELQEEVLKAEGLAGADIVKLDKELTESREEVAKLEKAIADIVETKPNQKVQAIIDSLTE